MNETRILRSIVKKLCVIVLTLCITSCEEIDTKSGFLGRGSVEPRLSGGHTWAGAAPPSREPCAAEPPVTYAAAVKLLAEEPDCTDEAVEALQRISRGQPQALVDLGAAYYIRANQENRVSDLLRAYDALHTAPDTNEARFNRALVEEALGVHASWDRYLERDRNSPWAKEAERRRKPRPADAVSQWQVSLQAALQSRDAKSAAKFIAPFPGVAQVYFEDELIVGNPASLEVFAEALHLNTKDPLARDVARAMRTDRRGVTEFRPARAKQKAMQDAQAPLLQSAELLRAAGNPLHLVAQVRYAGRAEPTVALAMLDRVEPEVRRRGYHHLLARIHSTRGYFLGYQSDFVGSLTAYDLALKQFVALRDFDQVAGTHARVAGVLRRAGDVEGAAREILLALRDSHRVVGTNEQQNVYGELSTTARSLGLPRFAWLYADRLVADYRARLTAIDPSRTDDIRRLQKELISALNNRAAVAVDLRDYARANVDLDEANRLSAGDAGADPNIRMLTSIALSELRGRASALRPREAIAAYTNALRLVESDTFLTGRASLYAQRADAYMRAGFQKEAGEDLRRAVAELEIEEKLIYDRPASEELPPGYFARFQDTYLHLIRQSIDRRDVVQAFMYAEFARAPEAKKLLAQLRLKGMAQFRSIHARLPQNSALLLYSVMEDRTYVWVVSARRTSVHRLEVTKQDVERWTRALYRAVERRRDDQFDEALYAPYAELFAPILRSVDVPRLVIVPDGAMHALPFVALRNPDNRRYLVEDYVIETAPSATLYAYARVRDAMLVKSAAPSLLAMGNPAFDPALPLIRDFPDLPHAALEAKHAGDLYGTAPILGKAATVPAFLNGAARVDIVHFAGHAVVNPIIPASSYLLMAPSPGNSGVLRAQDLLRQLKLDRTRLVILSACSSAGGQAVGSEGVAPLVRPILAAGVPAVIGSLWNVNDATTRELLVSFHRHYRQHKDAAVALREAQLTLIHNRRRSLNVGFAWAPFQVIGHASSPFAPPAQTDKGEPP
jgi:CHAT domain-containing protein